MNGRVDGNIYQQLQRELLGRLQNLILLSIIVI
nr:MAG TPA: hypothetical protein [Caudoviricetes sp.]